MIYLWTDDNGWTEHELTNTQALKERRIKIHPTAIIEDGAWIGDGTEIGYGAEIGARAWIGDGTWVGARATIKAGTWIGDGGQIPPHTRPKIIYLVGSGHPVSYWGQDRIDIGCRLHTISYWQEHIEEIGQEHGYTPEQIEEYHGYVEFIASVHKKEQTNG